VVTKWSQLVAIGYKQINDNQIYPMNPARYISIDLFYVASLVENNSKQGLDSPPKPALVLLRVIKS
jgi:hypothetical protein